MTKLNLGAGSVALEGWTSIDRKLGSEVFPLAYADNSVDAIRASHVLEHFSHRETLAVLKDWARALKPGGMIKIAVPDLNYAIQHAEHPHFEGWICGGQTDENDFHGALFTDSKLRQLLTEAGLQDIQIWTSEIQDCASLPVSLNLSAVKPGKLEPERPKIACAVSIPRLGFNDSWGCAVNALSPWAIPIRRHTGVWWERSLQNVFEELIEEGFEYVVTIDYDSMFTASQFKSLFEHIRNNPTVDAMSSLQPQRGNGHAMFDPVQPKTNDAIEVQGDKPFEVKSAHFGLTILRLGRLKDIPKPWFLNVPGKDGSWRREAEGLVDADIYFWRKWREHGRNCWILPWVSIGHIESFVSMIDPATGKTRHMATAKWIHEKLGDGE